MSITAFL